MSDNNYNSPEYSDEIKRKSKAPLVIAIIIIAIAAVYIGGVLFFRNRFLPNTKVGDLNVGMQTAAELKAELQKDAQEYSLTITDRKGDKYTLDGEDISYQYKDTGAEEKLLKRQSSALWPAAVLGASSSYQISVSSSYDQSALESAVSRMAFMQKENMTAPVAAHLDTSDGVKIVKETKGTTVIPSKVYSTIEKAVDSQESHVTLTDSCYESPKVTSEDSSLKKAVKTLEKYEKATVTYKFGDYTEKLTADKIPSLLSISSDGTISVSKEKVASYVQQLASKYNTYGRKRKFKTHKGDTITIGGGDYGWVVSKSKEAEELIKDLKSFKPTTREPVWEQEGKQYKKGKKDIGNTYIEVDFTNQHMYYYKNGKLKLDSAIVSGNTSAGNGSPDGVYKIVYKQSPATLVGETYTSPVKYFMPFAYNVGFHDADGWRSSYGGTIYKTNGSHGCINMPGKKAKKLYQIAAVGTPVIAYYREHITLHAENCAKSNAYSYRAS